MEERFQLLERLGVGGTAVVWRARDAVLERDVALKVLSAAAAPDPAKLEQFRLEARVAAGLRHPHIVEIFDYGEAPGMPGELPIPYVVMELVEGRTLASMLSGGPLPWRTATVICAEVAAALAAAHDHGVVHRDVKPGNIMVGEDGAKLVDFGISASTGTADVVEGELLGTPAYLAPERLDAGPVHPASDVYGLGLLLYRALAGRMPWQAQNLTDVVRAHLCAEPDPLPAIDGLPRAVTTVLDRCLAKRPEDRPTAAQVADQLKRAVMSRRKPLRLLTSGPLHVVDRAFASRSFVPPRLRGWRAGAAASIAKEASQTREWSPEETGSHEIASGTGGFQAGERAGAFMTVRTGRRSASCSTPVTGGRRGCDGWLGSTASPPSRLCPDRGSERYPMPRRKG
ncbi:serine/threonine-protein kinase [Actinoplanes sp. TFC3]|uniref:serine/threonine-protein kinase n=1 Tax=Actinoplanes sp. TFC3 TaxID=1710355 RepID=UPI000A62B5E1|nr:serine/threonine-protein kinase [Actinoplanes sp. TFC3]